MIVNANKFIVCTENVIFKKKMKISYFEILFKDDLTMNIAPSCAP